ncbi:MAG: phenylalanine--tRNA ligase subunit beta [Nanobdellota archaeon]
MVVTTISSQVLFQALKQHGSKLTTKDVEKALFDMGMELKEEQEEQLTVEVTPDRLDLISAHGLARAIHSFVGEQQKIFSYSPKESDYTVKVTEKVSEVRPKTVCAVITGLSMSQEDIDEVIQVQEKLHATLGRKRSRGAIGIYPLDVISMPITYTADKPEHIQFKPLQADNEMTGQEILEQHETGIAYHHLLKDAEVYPYFIDANSEILSLPPIINSEKTGRVSSSTTDLFIECSGFETTILNELLVYLTTMFSDMGGEIHNVNVTYPDGSIDKTPHLNSRERKLHQSTIQKYLGLTLNQDEMKRLLSKMMYEVTSISTTSDDTIYELKAPCFRFDLWHEVDIMDDIARAYGFNNFVLSTPRVPGIGSELTHSRKREELARILVGLGFLETFTFAISNENTQFESLGLDSKKESYVPIANGNENQTLLRTRLLPELLKSISHNRSKTLPQHIFEGAFVTLPDKHKDVTARNELHLSALITDNKVTFTQIRQVLEAVLRSMNEVITFEPITTPYFIEGRSAKVLFDGKSIGEVGELHPKTLEHFGLQAPVGAFEISLEPFCN